MSKRTHLHKWAAAEWKITDLTVAVTWHCQRKGCAYQTESTHTFRRPRSNTAQVALATREYRELIGAVWPEGESL